MTMLLYPRSVVKIPSGLATFPGGVSTYLDKILAMGPLALWPLSETAGAVAAELINGWNGIYNGPTLANDPGIGDGSPAPLFDGINDRVNLPASFWAAFPTAEGSVFSWCKVPAAAWVDGATRRAFSTYTDANNYVTLEKTGGINFFRGYYVAGGAIKGKLQATGGNLAWFCFGLTWSKIADEVRGYYNGVEIGVALNGLGVWAGAIVEAYIGCRWGLTNFFSGWLKYPTVWNRPLTATEMSALAVVS